MACTLSACSLCSGFVFTYCILQECTLATLHTIFLYWAVGFPFSYRQFKLQKRVRYVHIISVVLALVIPLPGALIHLGDGYRFLTTPVYACSVRNFDFAFYTLVLPISIMMCITSCLMMLIFWTIFKVCLSLLELF